MKPATIFLVDDSEIIREVLAYHLESQTSVKVAGFACGEQMLDTIDKTCPDIVILDYNLGTNSRLNGFQILQRLRSKCSCSVIFISGVENQHIVSKVMAAGVNKYILKSIPNVMSEIINSVNSVLSEYPARAS